MKFTCPTCLSQCEPDRIACNGAVGNCPARAIVEAMQGNPIRMLDQLQQQITPIPPAPMRLSEPVEVKDHKGRRYIALTETDAITMREEYLRAEGTLAAFNAHEALMRGRDDGMPERFIMQHPAIIAVELVAVSFALWVVGLLIGGRLS